jgi:transcriptional regulator with XRE-family HTH domain
VIILADIFLYDQRKELIGERIKLERKAAKKTQESLAEEITAMTGSEKDISQSTVASWESGKTIPPLSRLIAMSTIFGCDISYLLGDYPQRRRDAVDVCALTGLSEGSATALANLNSWGINDITKTLDILIYDNSYHNIGTVNGHTYRYRSVLDLLNFFFSYKECDMRYEISSNGSIVERKDYDGTISTSRIALNSRVVENAVLMEIQQALINLKETHTSK